MRRSGGIGFRLIIVLLVAGVLLLIAGITTTATGAKKPVDLFKIDNWEDLGNGMHVKTTIPIVFDTVWSETETKSTYGVKTSEKESARGYMLPLVLKDTDGSYFIDKFIVYQTGSFSVPETMIRESDRWWNDYEDGLKNPGKYCDTTIEFDGKLRKMTSEELGFVNDYLKDIGVPASDIDSYIAPYVLISQNFTAGPIMLIVGIVLLAIAGLIIFLPIITAKRNSAPANSTVNVVNTYDPYSAGTDANNTYDPYNSGSQDNNNNF